MKGIILILFVSITIFAHPVIYKDGFVYQGTFMPQMNEIRAGYTFDPNYAFTLNANYFAGIKDYQDYTAGINMLAKRWLEHDSQGNLYLGLHGGTYEDSDGKGQTVNAFAMGDWESREHYVMGRVKSFWYDGEKRDQYIARYGFAPYIAGMDELQAWMIVQGMYLHEQNKEAIITPMMRFFYKTALWEIGHSTRGQTYLTLMMHY